MKVILKIKDNLYQELKNNKRKLIKKNVLTNLTIDTNDIITVSDLLNNRGNILKNYCRIYIKEVGQVMVNHSHDYINKIKNQEFNQIGFKQNNK